MKYAIQCKDAKTGKTGSFGYSNKDLGTGLFQAITPVFPDCVGLFAYAKEREIELIHWPEVKKVG